MQKYLGTKLVIARPMNRRDYNAYRDWDLPKNEDGSDEGMLVEYVDGGKPNDDRHTGYISWSPLDMFENAYRPIDKLTFGEAIEAMRQGHKVARSGWNGKGMFLYLVQAGRYPPTTPAGHEIAAEQADGLVPYVPYIAMKTVQGDVVPWLASQTDVLAEDWSLVDGLPYAVERL